MQWFHTNLFGPKSNTTTDPEAFRLLVNFPSLSSFVIGLILTVYLPSLCQLVVRIRADILYT